MSETEKKVPRWYVVHTYSGYENKVAANLERIVQNRKLQEVILDIKIPVEKVMEIKNNKEREVERKIFPGYVMVKMLMDDNTRYIVRNVRGVTGFVGSATDPIPLTDAEVESLSVRRKRESRSGITCRSTTRASRLRAAACGQALLKALTAKTKLSRLAL